MRLTFISTTTTIIGTTANDPAHPERREQVREHLRRARRGQGEDRHAREELSQEGELFVVRAGVAVEFWWDSVGIGVGLSVGGCRILVLVGVEMS